MKLQQSDTRWCILFGLPVIGVLIIGCLAGGRALFLLKSGESQPTKNLDNPISQDAPDRETAIPPNAIKGTLETDSAPPILHSDLWQAPIPVPGEVNTAGAEDSPFVTPDGNKLYFFFTPDLTVPHEKQVLDGVTGIYTAELSDGHWGNVKRLVLQTPGKLALDGCPFVQDSTIWFCSAREGYTGLHIFTARHIGDEVTELRIAEDQFGTGFQVGELHITADQKEMYYHSPRPGGKGQLDIWLTRQENGVWTEPENVELVNSPETDGWPFVSQDHRELWFTRTYQGSPAIFRSLWSDDSWTKPELIVSQFAGEPTLDDQGNLFFVHHFLSADGLLLEADIYVAYRR